MKKRYFLLTLLFVTMLSFGQSVGDIIITEIMLNPAAVTDANGEYFEVYNTTGSSIDMNGWVISDTASDSHIINLPVNVPAMGYVIFGRNGDSGTNGGVTVDYDYSSFIIGNVEDAVIITTGGGTEIDRVEYDATFPNPIGASMELATNKYNSTDNDDGANWGAATTSFGEGDLGTPSSTNGFVLSVKRNEIENFTIYPNPVINGRIIINTMSNSVKIIEIFDVLGKQVLVTKLKENGVLNVERLNTGVYIIKVKEEEKITTSRLLVE